jgi:hypothetical protein
MLRPNHQRNREIGMSGYMHELAITAILRQAAENAEKRLAWAEAAELWRQAIDNYPSSGALAELDKRKMTARMDACLASASATHDG